MTDIYTILYVEDVRWTIAESKDLVDVYNACSEADGNPTGIPRIELIVARDYAEAAEALGNRDFQAIISDYHFPDAEEKTERGGIDFYARATSDTPEIPFFFLSGTALETINAELGEQGLRIDERFYVSKKKLSLITAIEAVLKESQPQTPESGRVSNPKHAP